MVAINSARTRADNTTTLQTSDKGKLAGFSRRNMPSVTNHAGSMGMHEENLTGPNDDLSGFIQDQ